MFLHPPGDETSDCFRPPSSLSFYPYFLQERTGAFLDVGAHVGTCSIFASYFFPKVISFEPESRNLQILTSNIQNNQIQNIEIINKAVSNYCGTTEFYIENSVNTGRNSILARPNSQKVEVEVVTIDSVFADSTPSLSYVKIDVEGLEGKVIQGMQQTIDRQSPKPIMQIEFMPSRWNREANLFWGFVAFINKNDYVPFMTTQGLICPLDVTTLVGIFENWKQLNYDSWFDLYLVPRSCSSQENISRACGQSYQAFLHYARAKNKNETTPSVTL
ncbi:MAG: FkbM family methyltransferase [Cyanobacteriota bacterium]|nr:FkbM family methyltransferase [Cyanobacteriota bacterium]